MKINKLFTLILLLQICNSGFCQMDDYRFWITKLSGGNGYGKISSINTDGSDYNHGVVFEGAIEGRTPVGGILQGSDGYLYGVTRDGGLYDRGVVFKMSADGSSYSVLHHFTKKLGANPSGGLIESSNGKLYGISKGIEAFPSIAFGLDKTTGDFEVIHEFTVEPDLLYPISIMQASNGNIYGICERGINGGAIFRINLATNEYDKLADLTSLYPGKLLESSDGVLYGTLGQANQSSVNGASIYKINLDGSGFTTIFEFNSIGTSNPARQMIEGPDGYLYGTTSPSTAIGLIYKVKKDGSDFDILHEFSYEGGYSASDGLILAADGLLYGFTTQGAAFGKGAFYRINTDGLNYELVKELDSDFQAISSTPVETTDGHFYATSFFGGQGNNGSVHRFSANGTYSKIKDFAGSIGNPQPLFYTKSNEIYGINGLGGTDGYGGIFKLAKDGSNNLTPVYENNLADKAIVTGNFAEDNNGNLFSFMGGFANSIGKLSPDNALSKIYEFPDNTFTWTTIAPLFYASDGFLYGISAGGGTHGRGTLYRIKTDGSEFSIQHSFEQSTIQRQPVQFESNGYLYGVCNGGVNGRGSIYRFNLITKDFERIFDLTTYFGLTSFGFLKLLKGSDNLIYGSAASGGSTNNGLIFKMTMEGTGFQELHSFSFTNKTEGFLPMRILEGPDSKLYGITGLGGDHDAGLIFSMKKDGSEYQKVFNLPEETELRFPADVDIKLIPKIPHQMSFSLPSNTFKVSDGPLTLTASSDAGLAATFSSSDPSVAKIDGSTLTFLGVGEVTITAQPGNDFYTRANATETLIIVKGEQSLVFNPISSKTVSENSFDLAATANSDLPVSYSTSADNITISGNKVTVLSPGRVTIIAHQEGNVNYNGAASIEQSFCINPAKPVVTDDRLTSNSLLLTSSSDTGNQWYFNGTEIGGATQSTLTVVEDGAYTVKTTVDDCSSELSDEYSSIVTGIETLSESNIAIYPNPVHGKLTLEVKGNIGPILINIIDVTGKNLINREFRNEKEVIDFGLVKRGSYFLQMRIKNKVYIKQILKK